MFYLITFLLKYALSKDTLEFPFSLTDTKSFLYTFAQHKNRLEKGLKVQ